MIKVSSAFLVRFDDLPSDGINIADFGLDRLAHNPIIHFSILMHKDISKPFYLFPRFL
jgi:hypothetical protein